MRIKLEGSAVYHVVTRTVARQMPLDRRAKEVLRTMLWQVAEFSGVEILAYCLMTNHLHILVRVPEMREGALTTDELIRRYRILYPDGSETFMPDSDALAAILKDEASEEAGRWRARLCRRMHDLSEFMRTLKQRYTLWYNYAHQGFGTLWAERFKSTIVEDAPAALKVVAAYIDLNPVRAGLAADPGDYRWSSYGEAMGGMERAQNALANVVGQADWDQAAPDYRMVLFGKGAQGRVGEQGAIDHEKAMEVLAAGGKLPPETLLRCRLRYLSAGAIIGSEAFVRATAEALRVPGSKRGRHALGRIPTNEPEVLCSWRRLQVKPVG